MNTSITDRPALQGGHTHFAPDATRFGAVGVVTCLPDGDDEGALETQQLELQPMESSQILVSFFAVLQHVLW
jgi:hypothetical protein